MWRSVIQQDVLRPGDRLRKDLFIGNGYSIWTEYEIIETGELEITLKPLVCTGHPHPGDPASYKRMRYPVLYETGMRIWITAEEMVIPQRKKRKTTRHIITETMIAAATTDDVNE